MVWHCFSIGWSCSEGMSFHFQVDYLSADYQNLRENCSLVVLFIISLIISFAFLWSGPDWKVQENCGPDCSSVGHPTKHCRHPQVIKGRETERKFWSSRLWVEQRGYGPAERVGQELQDQPTCQVLGNKLVCLIISTISFENVPLPLKNKSRIDVLLIAPDFWNCEIDWHHGQGLISIKCFTLFRWPLLQKPAGSTSWVILSNYSQATIWTPIFL